MKVVLLPKKGQKTYNEKIIERERERERVNSYFRGSNDLKRTL